MAARNIPTRAPDGTGTLAIKYGKLGERTEETRTVTALVSSPESYTTGYEWDSFGRMHSITFNDGEKVTYKYDAGGLVNQVYGEVTGSDPIHYVEALEYDKFGRRAYIDRNNITQTYYTYNAQNGRLEKLKTEQNSASNIIQDITYTYDDADNITKMVNNSPEPKRGFGGPATQNFSYDDLYRLTGADGTYKSDDQYTLAMEYDNVHNITRKNQSHWILDRKGVPDYQEGTTYDWNYTYSASHPHQPTQIGSIPYTYDLNGNQTGFVTDTVTRVIAWDEENRVKSVTDNGSATNFVYDHEGQRIAKSGSQGTTVYVNQFYSVRNGSIWTKSIMVGNERVATKVHTSNAQDVYYHGSDHLGSTNYLVDGTGNVHEHLEYFPFGEMWVDERSTTERTPYLYTGKELDEEIGLYYFGARYYDPRTSVWQSQDPILGQYLPTGDKRRDARLPGNGGVFNRKNLAVYSYSHLNPIRYSDPDGRVVPLIAAITAYVEAVISSPDFVPDITMLSYDLAKGDTVAIVADLIGLGIPGIPSVATRGGAKYFEKVALEHGDELMSLARQLVKHSDEVSKGGIRLTRGGTRKIGSLAEFKDMKVIDLIKARGGKGSNANVLKNIPGMDTPISQMKVGEIANLAAQGNKEAETAIKIIKQARQKGQDH